MRRLSSHLCHGATGQRNSACVQKRSPKKLQKVTFSKPSFRTFFTAVMVALCTTFSADSRVPQKAQKSSEIHRFRNFFVITQHYRFFISADYLLPDMELQQKEQLQTQDQHEHADHQKRYVHQKQKAHPAYLLPQGKTPHQYGHSIFAGF